MKIAKLDDKGIFLEFVEVDDKAALPKDAIVLADEAAPRPGLDRYDADSETFVPVKTRVAKLDSAGVFFGTEEIDLADLTDGQVHLPGGADNPPGKYRWDFDARCLVPLPAYLIKKTAETVSSDRALYELCVVAHKANIQITETTMKWAGAYEASWDAEGGKLLNYFRPLIA